MMADRWDLFPRTDGRVEVVCPHGIGHTSHVLTERRGVMPMNRYFGDHGCDGCCGVPAFKEFVAATTIYLESDKKPEEK